MVGRQLVEHFVDAVRFDGADDLVRALDEIRRDRIDVDALAREDGDEPLRLQPDQRVAQGRLADFEPFADLILIEKFAVGEHAGTHGVLEVLVHAFAQ